MASWTFWKNPRPGTNMLLSGPQNDGTLKDAFCNAAYGRTCRTQSYACAVFPEKTEWLEAVAVGGGSGWRILKKTRDGQHFSGLPAVEQKEAARNLTFFDAVEYLARYEAAQMSQGFVGIVPDEVSQLGFSHFTAFARREGIAFDLDGQPHPTDRGLIVTNGNFSASEYEMMQISADQKQALFENGETLPVMSSQSFQEKKVHMHATEDLLDMLRAALRTMKDAPSDSAWFIEHAYKDYVVDINAKWEATYKNLSVLLNPKKLAKLQLSGEFEALVMKFRCDFFAHAAANVLVLRERNDFPDKHKYYYTREHAAKIEKRVASLLQDSGYSGDCQQLAFRDVQNARSMIEQGSPHLLKNFENIINRVEEVLALHKQGLGISPQVKAPGVELG